MLVSVRRRSAFAQESTSDDASVGKHGKCTGISSSSENNRALTKWISQSCKQTKLYMLLFHGAYLTRPRWESMQCLDAAGFASLSALVRAKALHTMAEVTAVASETEVVADVIKNLFDHERADDKRDTVDFEELLQDPEADLSSVNPLPQSETFIDFLRKRALDESVFVRKNALQVLENILKFYASESQELESVALDLVRILAEHCRDPSVMVRKQIASSLTEIVKAYPDNDKIIHFWVEGVFPLIVDVEQKCAEKVIECIYEVLIANIVPYALAKYKRHFLPWKILKATEKSKMTKYLSRACAQWAKNKQLKANTMAMLKGHIDTENSDTAWMLLAVITAHVPLENPKVSVLISRLST